MKIMFEEENGQMYVPVGKREITLEKEGYKKAVILAHIDENGIFNIIKTKDVEIGQKPVNILKEDGTCERMNKVAVHMVRNIRQSGL